MATTMSETDRDVPTADCDQISSEYSEEMKRLVVTLMTLDDFDDVREIADETFHDIPEDERKISTLYGFSKEKGESDEFRAYSLYLLTGVLHREGKTIVLKLDKDGKLAPFCEDILEAFNAEASEKVRYGLAEVISYIERSRVDEWIMLNQFMAECIASNDDSMNKRALEMMRYHRCKLPGVKNLIADSIIGSDPSLRKPAIRALAQHDVEEDQLEMVIPILIMLIEKGCCRLPDDLDDASWKELTKLTCDGEHSVAVEILYDYVQNTYAMYVDKSNTKEYEVLNKHVERIFEACTETILNRMDCDMGKNHDTAMQMNSVLIETYSHRFPDKIIPELLVCGLISIGRQLSDSMKQPESSNPNVNDHSYSFPVTTGHWFMKPILTKIGQERIGDALVLVTEGFLKSDDVTRRGAALIGWSILEKEWRQGRLPFLIDMATDGLSDEHPRVRSAAADLLAAIGRGSIITDFSDQIIKMVSTLVSAVADPVPRVATSAIVALVCLRSDVDLLSDHYSALLPLLIARLADCPANKLTMTHACSIDLIATLAVAVGKNQFMNDFAAVERAICTVLASLNSSFKFYKNICSGVAKVCQLMGDDNELARVFASIQEKNQSPN